jgi:curved DNA-binding protein CbpA
MDAKARIKVEVETLHQLLAELNYYKILQLDPSCEQHRIDEAHKAESRRLHPDRMASLGDAGIKSMANDIFQLINEANTTLKDPEQRTQYDALMAMGVLRMTEDAMANAQDQKRANDPEFAASDPKAEKYWKLAMADWKEKKYGPCVMNIQFALNFEKDNEIFKEWLLKAKEARAETDKNKEKNPYKLRIM